MGFKTDLDKDVQTYFDSKYEITEGTVIPDVGDIALGPKGRNLDLAMLFIDVRESTNIVDAFRRLTAARMYKGFLSGVTQIARNQDGQLRSFNGDGVLVAFIGERMRSRAVKTAMHLKAFGNEMLKPKLQKYFDNNKQAADVEFDFGIGVHVGKVLVVRGGIRGANNNDLVWVGNATNYAVRLSSLGENPYNIHVTGDVYEQMAEDVKYVTEDGVKKNMWQSLSWQGETIYRTTYQWALPD